MAAWCPRSGSARTRRSRSHAEHRGLPFARYGARPPWMTVRCSGPPHGTDGVGERVHVQQHEIGDRAGLDAARVAASEQLGIHRGCCSQRLQNAVDLDLKMQPSSCSSSSSPMRSVPKPIRTPAARAISTAVRPAAGTSRFLPWTLPPCPVSRLVVPSRRRSPASVPETPRARPSRRRSARPAGCRARWTGRRCAVNGL